MVWASLFILPSDAEAMAQICSRESQGIGLAFFDKIKAIQDGTDPSCPRGGFVKNFNPPLSSCPGPLGLIKCVNLDSQSDCGPCGHVCKFDQQCQAHHCVNKCQSPNTHFDLTFNACIPNCTGDLKNLPPNGNCGCPALPGGISTQSGDKCVDTNTNKDNCGSCGNVCSSGQTCSGGTCEQTCNSGQTYVENLLNVQIQNQTPLIVVIVAPPTEPHAENGECKCPTGQAICGGQCTETRPMQRIVVVAV